jgi:tRNA(adenine34) deaminase
MSFAINLAEDAYKKNEVPVGAIIVKDDKIIGSGHNSVISDCSVSAHAEINAINEASNI